MKRNDGSGFVSVIVFISFSHQVLNRGEAYPSGCFFGCMKKQKLKKETRNITLVINSLNEVRDFNASWEIS